jgi:hypothetical protein
MYLKLIRGIDGIVYGVAILLFLILDFVFISVGIIDVAPGAGRTELGHLNIVCALPVACIAWFTLRLPDRVLDIPDWPITMRRVRLLAVTTAGLVPLAVWWTRVPSSRYLLANMAACLLVGVGFLFHFSRLLERLAEHIGEPALHAEARMTRFLVFWLMFVIMIAMIFVVAIGTVMFRLQPSESVFRLLAEIRMHPWVLWFPLTPVVFFTSVLVRLRLALVARLEAIANAASEDTSDAQRGRAAEAESASQIETDSSRSVADAVAAVTPGDTPLVIDEKGLAEG